MEKESNMTTSPAAHPTKPSILANAAAVVLGHNHPSGVPTPSQEDRALTTRLVEAGKLLGIQVLDHITIRSIIWNMILITLLLVVHFMERKKNIIDWVTALPLVPRWSIYIIMSIVMVLFGKLGGAPFIYFQF